MTGYLVKYINEKNGGNALSDPSQFLSAISQEQSKKDEVTLSDSVLDWVSYLDSNADGRPNIRPVDDLKSYSTIRIHFNAEDPNDTGVFGQRSSESIFSKLQSPLRSPPSSPQPILLPISQLEDPKKLSLQIDLPQWRRGQESRNFAYLESISSPSPREASYPSPIFSPLTPHTTAAINRFHPPPTLPNITSGPFYLFRLRTAF